MITREAPKSPTKSVDRVEGGVITYDHGDTKKTIMYFLKDCERNPRVGEKVRFDIYLVRKLYILKTTKSNKKLKFPGKKK